MILINQYLINEKETSDGVLSKNQEFIFHISLEDIQDVWRHVGLIASTLIIEVKTSGKKGVEEQLEKFEIKMDDATCQKWADTLSELIGCQLWCGVYCF